MQCHLSVAASTWVVHMFTRYLGIIISASMASRTDFPQQKGDLTAIYNALQEGQTILVQEYMENGDLYHGLAEDTQGRFGWYRQKQPNGRPVPNTGMARRIALDTARGLFFLHSRK